jgi:integrase
MSQGESPLILSEWYELVVGDQLMQGDIFEDCPVFRPPSEWSDIKDGFVTIAAGMDQNTYRPCTKEKEIRKLPIHPQCLEELETLPRALNGFVFTYRGKPLRKEYVNATWRRAARRAGVNINCYQGTRHSLISQLLNAGYSEALVRQIAGHRCDSSIQRYRHLKAESLRPLIERQVVEIRKAK